MLLCCILAFGKFTYASSICLMCVTLGNAAAAAVCIRPAHTFDNTQKPSIKM